NLCKDRSRINPRDRIDSDIKGGLSGAPTQQLANELISQTYRMYGDQLVIIGVGGIFSAADAYEKIKRGASLVQLITGMIYEGPQLIGEINIGLVKLLREDGFNHVSEAIGIYHK
ncbi:MAG: dihydroorotate dehydrogenase (quinone), partial [Parcubacteria group bacterium]|nr:dihydroorotate dehydrogenase (quinone) [Parcubacteria group bacterium]